jgi:molybdopterin converting factor small subunit
MSVQVRIPTILRTYTDGASEVEVSPAEPTLAAAPGIRGRVLDDTGALRRFVNVYVDDEDVRFTDGLGTPVKDGAKISIIPAVAGG